MAKTYKVVYTLEDDGKWGVTIPGDPGGVGCFTWGKSVAQARNRVRDALEACLDDEDAAAEAIFEEEFVTPRGLRQKVKKVRAAKAKLAKLEAESSTSMREVARELTDAGLSLRDAADVLGISYQRVHQLLSV